MALASDKTLKQFAGKLDEWSENLSYSTSTAKNLWLELNLSLYPRDMQDTISWLAAIPGIEKKITSQLEELSKLVQEVDAWRNHGIYPEDLEEFRTRIDRLEQVTLNIIHILRNTSEASEIQPPASEAIAVEKSDLPQTQETGPAVIKPDVANSKMPRKEALTAYKLYFDAGLTLPQIARRMTAELKLDKLIRQNQVARWIKQVVQWHIRMRIPIQSVPPRSPTTAAHAIKTNSTAQIDHKNK
jgi:hypothetical protein